MCRRASLNAKAWKIWATTADHNENLKLRFQFTSLTKFYNRRLKKRCLVWWLSISAVGSEFGINDMKAWVHPALYQRFKLVSTGLKSNLWHEAMKKSKVHKIKCISCQVFSSDECLVDEVLHILAQRLWPNRTEKGSRLNWSPCNSPPYITTSEAMLCS